jgi:hydrogenase-4 membrane subunit HyfE
MAWITQHAGWLAAASALLLILGIAVMAALVVKIPPDFFLQDRSKEARSLPRAILVNSAGFLLAAMGIVMSLPLVPGPGLVLILLGLSMMKFPGKRKLELLILRRHWVLSPLNALREKLGHPPLKLPEPHQSG